MTNISNINTNPGEFCSRHHRQPQQHNLVVSLGCDPKIARPADSTNCCLIEQVTISNLLSTGTLVGLRRWTRELIDQDIVSSRHRHTVNKADSNSNTTNKEEKTCYVHLIVHCLFMLMFIWLFQHFAEVDTLQDLSGASCQALLVKSMKALIEFKYDHLKKILYYSSHYRSGAFSYLHTGYLFHVCL